MFLLRSFVRLRALAAAVALAAVPALAAESAAPLALPAWPDQTPSIYSQPRAAAADEQPAPPIQPVTPAKFEAPAAAAPVPNPPKSDPRRLAPPRDRHLSRAAKHDGADAKADALPSLGLPLDSMYTTATALAVVLGIFLLFAGLVRRGGKKSNSLLPEEVVSVLGRVPLAARQFAELVRVGNKLLLISVTPGGAEPLTEITDPAEIDRLVGLCRQRTKGSSTDEFEKVFRQLAEETAPTGFLGNEATRVTSRAAPGPPPPPTFTPLIAEAPNVPSLLRSSLILAFAAGLLVCGVGSAFAQTTSVAPLTPPSIAPPMLPNIGNPQNWTSPEGLASTLQVMLLLTVISLAPAILLMTTSFVRIIVVFGLLRQALGTQQLPPGQVITSIALFMTVLLMFPVWKRSYDEGIKPYTDNQISLDQAFERSVDPIRHFMADQIMSAENDDDVFLFLEYVDAEAPEGQEPDYVYYDPKPGETMVPLVALIPAFMLSELKIAFLIGFQIYLPFVVIDLVVASVTISMGMLMLPPVLVSLPFKLLLFVLVDGWRLIVQMLLDSFHLL